MGLEALSKNLGILRTVQHKHIGPAIEASKNLSLQNIRCGLNKVGNTNLRVKFWEAENLLGNCEPGLGSESLKVFRDNSKNQKADFLQTIQPFVADEKLQAFSEKWKQSPVTESPIQYPKTELSGGPDQFNSERHIGCILTAVNNAHQKKACIVVKGWESEDRLEKGEPGDPRHPQLPVRISRDSLANVRSETFKFSKKSVGKYNCENIAMIKRPAWDARLEKYGNLPILPDFIHGFLTDPLDVKYQAFLKNKEQFAATPFRKKLGGIVTMPNAKHNENDAEVFKNPREIKANGFALVGYWIPPNAYESQTAFIDLFGGAHGNDTESSPDRLTISEYNEKNSSRPFLTNVVDLQKSDIPLLQDFQRLLKIHLKDVYDVDVGKRGDSVNIYCHVPLYADQTAGLHIHVRVNQAIHPAEKETMALPLQDIISILETDTGEKDYVKNKICEKFRKTSSDKFLLFSPVFQAEQFDGIPVELKPNPFAHPA